MRKRAKYSVQELQAAALPLPNDFYSWLGKEVFKSRHFMFYTKIGRGKYNGYCYCGATEVPLTKIRSGQLVRCPVCGNTVRLRSDRYDRRLTQTDYVAFVQRTQWGYLSRIMYADMVSTFKDEQVTEKYYLHEKQWDVLDWENEERQYHFACGSNSCVEHLIRGAAPKAYGFYNVVSLEERTIKTYPNNLRNIFADNEQYKYSQIEIAARYYWLNPIEYLLAYREKPQLEMLIKMGLYRLSQEFYLAVRGWTMYEDKIKKKAKNLFVLTGLKRKKYIDYCVNNDYNIAEIGAYLKLKGENAKITPPLVQFAVAAENVRSRHGFANNVLPLQTLYGYYLTQKENYSEVSDFLGDYGDYLRWCVDLQRNLHDTKFNKPKDFKYAHDITMNEHAEWEQNCKKEAAMRAEQKRIKVISELAPHYKALLEYKAKGLCVVVPMSPNEIIAEGKAQGHCVGSYVNRVAEGNSVIVFLRDAAEPDKPYYTVELNPLDNFKLVQCRGKSNCGYGAEISAFLNLWKKVYLTRLAKFDAEFKTAV